MSGPTQVHQSLHGYADGHSQLATSIKLSPRDARAMLVLSDLAGAGGKVPESGYLTGYPLFDAGLYVLAKTWEATEMRRPGCVWTHSLLIAFSDLAWISPSQLISVFQRPLDGRFADYRKVLPIFPLDRHEQEFTADIELLKRLMSALYSHPKKGIYADGLSNKDAEECVLSIWSQQWPKLKRNFRFCTSATVERSIDTTVFDLLIVRNTNLVSSPSFRNSLNFRKLKVAEGNWLDCAVDDIVNGNNLLSNFLRNVGGDVIGGREAFSVLAELFSLTEYKRKGSSVNEMIRLLERDSSLADAKIARSIIINSAIHNVESLSDQNFAFLLDQMEWVDKDTFDKNAERIGRAVWRRLPNALVKMALGKDRMSTVAAATIEVLPAHEILDGCRRDPDVLISVAYERPDILQYDEAWAFETQGLSDVLMKVTFSTDLASRVLQSVVRSGRPEMANATIERFGAVAVWQELSRYIKVSSPDLSNLQIILAETILSDILLVTNLLSNGQIDSWLAAAMIAKRTYPDSVPNDYGEDPWSSTLSILFNNSDEPGDMHVLCYALARAFGYKSREPSKLARLTFAHVYEAAKYNSIDYHSWNLLEYKLPTSYFSNWDRCKRLREGVCELFSYKHLSESDYINLVNYDSDFLDLVNTTNKSYTGQKYLKDVKRYLKNTYGSEEKNSIIKVVLKEKS